jgi:glucosamine--fructose-6-phosphate aminotransferase (isomerizing)
MEKPDIHTYGEITGQPAAWRSAVDDVREKADLIGRFLGRKQWSEVLFTGCGSTYYLSLAAAAHFQETTGMRARGLPSSELLLFPRTVLAGQGQPLLVSVSRSGTTTETLRATDIFAEQYPENVLAVTCYADETLAQKVPLSLVVREGAEEGIAQTRSFAGMWVAVQALAAIVAEDDAALGYLETLPSLGEDLLRRAEPLSRQIADNDDYQQFFFLGSGHRYGLACEVMLKMKEVSLSQSEAYHFMEFRHGPMSMVTKNTLVVGLLSDSAREQEIAVLEHMRRLGATTLVVAEDGEAGELGADHLMRLGSGIPEAQRGVLYLPALQLLAFHRAVRKGLNPDKPNNLAAVIVLDDLPG